MTKPLAHRGRALGAWLLLLGFAMLLVTARPGFAEVKPESLPTLTGRVVDGANVIKPDVREALRVKLKSLEDQSGIQIVVATVPSLQGEEIEPYANALFRAWKLGEKGKNNGLLFLIAPNEHRARFEVGYGLEGTLTDALTKLILRNAVTPKFKTGDYGAGITAGVDEAIAVLTTDKSSWQKRPALKQASGDQPVSPGAVIFFFVFFLLIIFMVWRNRNSINWTSAGTGFVVGSMLGGGRGGGGGGGSRDSGDNFSGGGGDSGGGGSSDSW